MSEVKVNKISPRANCGTVTLGDSGDSFVIPSGATITNNGTQTGFGREGSVDWVTDSIKTATFTAVSGKGYFCNTTGGTFEVDLPAGSAGAIVSIQDYNNTFDSNKLTVDPNGSEKINGGEAGATVDLTTEGQGITFVYVDSTVGWRSVQENTYATPGSTFITATGGTITTVDTNYKVHTFTGPGTFTVCSGSGNADYMVIAGGGGGGIGYASGLCGGGGGAGGYRESHCSTTSGPYTASPIANPSSLPLAPGPYPITVGAGGAKKVGCSGCGVGPNVAAGCSGANSIFSSITSTGGGGGAGGSRTAASDAKNGGSGGGGGAGAPWPSAPGSAGGSGNTPPVSPPQGNDGGNGPTGANNSGGGGGGAGAAGSPNPSNCVGGAGGAGVATSINGTPTSRAGGGGASSTSAAAAAGGTGGGGSGARNSPATNAGDGTVNTGSGGGGGTKYSTGTGGNGGSGVVIIRYKFQ